jgi:hypothetical protein
MPPPSRPSRPPRRVALLLCGWAAACGAGATSRDGGASHPVDAGADASADGAPSDAGGSSDASVEDAGNAADAGNWPEEKVPCPGGFEECPPDAPYCCGDDKGGPSFCSPDWPYPLFWELTGYCQPAPPPLESSGTSFCFDYATGLHHPELCPDGFPFCCAPFSLLNDPECEDPGSFCSAQCVDRDLLTWSCER